jgi:hypothetical protein
VLSPDESCAALRRLFKDRRIADLTVLCKTLQTDAPRSVFRRLSLAGYLSSYNQNGSIYTLSDIPEFDNHGIWQYQGVFFSRHGTLKATITHLVETADSGYTHGELEVVLHVRVQNMLLDLVKAKRIGRELLDGLFLYVSANPGRGAAQVSQRRQDSEAAVLRSAREPGRPLVIEILLEIIHGARLVSDPADVTQRLISRGIEVTRYQVEVVFQQHELKKTRVRRSRSSQP